MNTKDVIVELRTRKGLSQDELEKKIYVTRQAVSRWETGETIPNTETLKLLSKLFNVSINTLLGSPRKLICQCCGMPLDDSSISKEKMVHLMKNIVNGVIWMENLFTKILKNCPCVTSKGNFRGVKYRKYMVKFITRVITQR